MTKKPSKPESQQPDAKQPAFVEELLTNGSVTITALSPDEFSAILKDIPAGVSYGTGAVGKNPETGVFSLRIDIINT